MDKTIFSIGFTFPGGRVQNLSLKSRCSLHDADVIVFMPHLRDFDSYSDLHQGKRRLLESDSFLVSEAATHWRDEIIAAMHAGKTVFIFLKKPEEVFVQTSQEFSGTKTHPIMTVNVTPFNSYRFVPLDISLKGGEGTVMKLASGAGLISSYWREFANSSVYECYLAQPLGRPLIFTKAPAKPVATLVKAKEGGGHIVLLPVIRFDEEFLYEDEEEDDFNEEIPWSKTGKEIGDNLISSLLQVDRELSSFKSPPPSWIGDSDFRLDAEQRLLAELATLEIELDSLNAKKLKLQEDIEEAGSLKSLLYEKGTALENVILRALTILGFTAKAYRDSESEFDSIFDSSEGRFLGEAEGKDNKPINTDKLDQLLRNLQEEFSKGSAAEYAKGVLFGNAHRLKHPLEREEWFTTKCVSGAKRFFVSLVRTRDLFVVARYVRESGDMIFAEKCRKAILSASGEAVFPPVPICKNNSEIQMGEEL